MLTKRVTAILISIIVLVCAMPQVYAAAPADGSYAYDQYNDKNFMNNTGITERTEANNGSRKITAPRAQADAEFTSTPILVDGVKEDAWSSAKTYPINHLFNGTLTAEATAGPTGELRFMWDGPVLYILVEVSGDTTKNDTGNPTWTTAALAPGTNDGLVVGFDVFNDKWGMENDTTTWFYLPGNANATVAPPFVNSGIRSLGSFLNSTYPDYSPRLKASKSSGFISGDSVNYTYEIALQIEGWGDVYDRELKNGTQIGIEAGIFDGGGSAWSFWSKTNFLDAREGTSNMPNDERTRNRDWGEVTLAGWNGASEFAYSEWSAEEAIRFWNSPNNPGAGGNYTGTGNGSLSAVWTSASKKRMVDAIDAYKTAKADASASRADKEKAIKEVCEAFAGLRWVDETFPDPHDLPSLQTIPDPYKFFDSSKGTNGYVTTLAEWEERKEEILALAEFYEYGYKPKLGVDYNITITTNAYAGTGNAVVAAQVVPTNTGHWTGGANQTLTVTVTNPTGASVGGQKAGLGFGVSGNGIAAVSSGSANWGSDNRTDAYAWGTRSNTFYTMFPFNRNKAGTDVSYEMTYATGVSLQLDILEAAAKTNSALAKVIDINKAATAGFSISGKLAFVAAAYDERVAVTFPGAAGATGPANWRYNAQGQEYDFTDTIYYNDGAESVVAFGTEGPGNSYRHNRVRETEMFRHFMPYGHMYEHEEGAYGYGNYSKLPFDQSLILSTFAPDRMIVLENCLNDFNDGAATDNMSFQLARSVYATFGADPDKYVKFNSANYANTGDPHSASAGRVTNTLISREFLFGESTFTPEQSTRLLTDPFNLKVSNNQTQSSYDYYWGGFNTITGGQDGIDGTDGWYYYDDVILEPYAEIEGVTIPVAGETPVYEIEYSNLKKTTLYTAKVSWAPELDPDGRFKPLTAYTATIEMELNEDKFILKAPEDFFTVEGAAATNDEDTFVVTAVFLETGTQVIDKSDLGLTAVAGEAPITSIENYEYTASVAWAPAHSEFKYNSVYVATVTLALEDGYTLDGIGASFFSLGGADYLLATSDPNVYRVIFPATELQPVDIAALEVKAPKAGETPETALETSQYTGSIAWAPADATFQYNTEYIATVTLTAKADFTFDGVLENFFAVEGADEVANAADIGLVTVKFPQTEKEPVSIADIEGVTAPLAGAAPATAIVENSQYAGTIEWDPEVDSTFEFFSSYTAVITLTAKDGFTFDGIPEDFFAVAGALEVKSDAGSGVVRATFPITGDEPASIPTIEGVTPPKANEEPATAITENSQYSGTVAWSPDPGEAFGYNTIYTANISLVSKPGYSLENLPDGFEFLVPGATSVTSSAGLIIAEFPSTGEETISIAEFEGPTAPKAGVAPEYAITPNDQYSGTVTWSPADDVFKYNTTYTATIEIIPNAGFTTQGVPADFFKVEGATVLANSANSGTITAAFPATEKEPVSIKAIELEAPKAGVEPLDFIIDNDQFSGTVVWSPAADTFGYSTAYTATITLTVKAGYTLDAVSADFFTVAGATATNAAGSGVVEAAFAATEDEPEVDEPEVDEPEVDEPEDEPEDVPTVQPPVIYYPGPSTPSTPSVPKSTIIPVGESNPTISDELGKDKAPVIVLKSGITGVDLSGDTLLGIVKENKDLSIQSSKYTVVLAPKLVDELEISESSSVRVLATKSDAIVKPAVVDRLVSVDAANKKLVEDIQNLGIAVDGKAVKTTLNPVKVEVSVADLSPAQKEKLTGILYDKASGTYKQLGGEISEDGKTFVFHIYNTGDYGIVLSDDLLKLKFEVGSNDYLNNQQNLSNDVAPFISAEGRTMIPIRVIAEALGAQVQWNQETRTAIIADNGVTLRISIGQPLANGLGTAVIVGDRTFVPIRYVSESLDANVVWDGEKETVSIYR
ncbi:MAG: hypothetical protein LBT59_00385 [Clostridiales bacterium]|jgi:hypothetical protein|nr:hypothetical protein [Clostridiales bacterium]